MESRSQASGALWMSVPDATKIEREILAKYARAILQNTRTTPNYTVHTRPTEILIAINRINQPNSGSARRLNERLAAHAAFNFITIEHKNVVLILSSNEGIYVPGILITGFNPVTLPFVLQKELSGGKVQDVDPQAWLALPPPIREHSEKFSPELIEHIISCVLRHLQSGVSTNPNLLFTNGSLREYPHIPVYVGDDHSETHDLVNILTLTKAKGEGLPLIKPVPMTEKTLSESKKQNKKRKLESILHANSHKRSLSTRNA